MYKTILAAMLLAVGTPAAHAQHLPQQQDLWAPYQSTGFHAELMKRFAPRSVFGNAGFLQEDRPSTDPRLCGTQPPIPVEQEWGCYSMPLPSYLRNDALGLLPEQGVLLTHVETGSPAATAGLCAGQLITAVDGNACMIGQPLPRLDQPRCLTVISDEGLCEITVRPPDVYSDPLLNSDPSLNSDPAQLRQRLQALRPLLPGVAWDNALGITSTASACTSRVRSLTASQVNGQHVICAVVDTVDGPVSVELRGTTEEILCQFEELAPTIQNVLGPELGL